MNDSKKNNLLKSIINVILIFSLILIFIFISKFTYNQLLQKKNFENSIISFANKNKKTIFSIDKIIFFSSCDSKNKTSTQTNFTIENLYSYTDIAIFINNKVEEKNLENTLKNVKITNIKFSKEPLLGNPNLYYKSINNFAKSEIEEKNKIEEELEFTITSENEADLSKPILYNNCANPITLSYINQNIKNDYTMIDIQNPIIYNGNLLKRCGVLISSIEASISFDIEIENNKNEKFKTTIYFDIPYKKENDSIYDGNLIERRNVKFDFYRYE